MIRLCTLLLFCLFPFFICEAAIPFHTHFTLENGLEVILLPSHRTKQAIYMTGYKVGARDEIIGKTGIAHFLEHMMFKGTEKFPGTSLTQFVEFEGGAINAFTSQDMTLYYSIITPELIEPLMRFEVDRMQHVIFNQEICDTERKVVLEERTMRLENEPSALFDEALHRVLFKNSPYARPIIGERKDIESLTVDDLHDFYKKYYVPNNAFILIAGDIDVKQVEKHIRHHYAALQPGIIPPRVIVYPEKDTVKKPRFISYASENVKQPEWQIFYKTPTLSTTSEKEVVSLDIGCEILGGGKTSRLYQALVVDKKIASNVSCNYELLGFYDDALSVSVTPQEGVSPEQISREVEKVISDMRHGPIEEEELVRAKLLNKAESVYFQEGLMNQAILRVMLMGYDLPLSLVEDLDFKIDHATKEDIREAFARYLVPENSVTGYLHSKNISKKGK